LGNDFQTLCRASLTGPVASPDSPKAILRGGRFRNAKQSVSIQDTAAERWSRLYVDVRASYGRAAIQAALLLNGAASVALLAFLGNLAIAQQTKSLAGNFVSIKDAFLIQNVAIAHPKDAEGRTGRRLRLVGIGMVVASLFFSQLQSPWRRTQWAI